MNTELDKQLKQLKFDLDLEIKVNKHFFETKIVNNPNYTQQDLELWNKKNQNLDKISQQIEQLQSIAKDLKKCQLAGKKKTKRNIGKKHKKKTKKNRNKKKQIGKGIPDDQGKAGTYVPGSESIIEQVKDIIFEDTELPENIENLKELIREDPSVVNQRIEYNRSNDTLLMIAIHKKKFEFAKVLIDNGADIYVTDREGENIMEKSIARKNLPAIKFLIKNNYFEITNKIINFAIAEKQAFGTSKDAHIRNEIIDKLTRVKNSKTRHNNKVLEKLDDKFFYGSEVSNKVSEYLSGSEYLNDSGNNLSSEELQQQRQQQTSNLTMNDILAMSSAELNDLSLTQSEKSALYQRLALTVNSTPYPTHQEAQQAQQNLFSLRAKLNVSGGKKYLKKNKKTKKRKINKRKTKKRKN